MGEAAGKITLKLLVDKKEKRVIFGEAGKEFVDFLFNFLSLPVGTVVKLLSKDKMVGSLGKIYESVEAMHANYMEPNVNKEYVLNPKVSSSSLAESPLLLGYKTKDEPNDYALYNCGCSTETYDDFTGLYQSHLHVSSDPNTLCPECGNHMNKRMNYVNSTAKEAVKVGTASGYVKGLVTYMVMDNLQVKPMSNISSITLLSAFKVKDLSALESVDVFIGKEEAVEMLKASFVTDKVLSHLFLGNPKA